jgi:CO dehydrogenase maturation factor
MKISICGKGGSGKSVIVTLLANEFKARGYRVLVIDSDESNSGLYRILGFDHPPTPLMELVGGKKGLKNKMAVRLSEGESEVKMEVLAQDSILVTDIPSQHIVQSNGLRLLSVGKILHSLEGCACPMGVLSREFLGKLRLETDEVAVVDMEAGVEHFGRGIETNIDKVLSVVEPSFESLELAIKVKELAAGAGVRNSWAILNKINSDRVETRLKDELGRRGIEVIGVIRYDPQVAEACLEGQKLGDGAASEDIRKVIDALTTEV